MKGYRGEGVITDRKNGGEAHGCAGSDRIRESVSESSH